MKRRKILLKRIGIGTIICLAVIAICYGTLHIFPTQAYQSPVVLNEVMCKNLLGLQDADGTYPDWIELYNTTDTPVDLSGYGLSDDADEPFRYTFPSGSVLGAGEYKVIFAGSDSTAPDHAPFGISEDDSIILTNADGQTIDKMVIPSKISDGYSVGRTKNNAEIIAVLSTPTPGTFNRSAIVKKAFRTSDSIEPPVFSAKGGYYSEPFFLEIRSSAPDTKIYYTLDGSEPNEQSLVYRKPILIQNQDDKKNQFADIETCAYYYSSTLKTNDAPVRKATVIRARACQNGVFSDEITTHSYFLNPGYTLPVISITTNPQNLFDDDNGIYVPGTAMKLWKKYNPEISPLKAPITIHTSPQTVPAYIEMFESDGSRVLGENVGIAIFGQWSTADRCKSLEVKTGKKYGSSSEFQYDIFSGDAKNASGDSITTYHDFILRNSGGGGGDWYLTMLRDAFMQRLVHPVYDTTQAYRPCILYIDGEYWGIHNIREKFTEHYFEDHYGIQNLEMAKFRSGRLILEDGPESARQDYLDLARYANTHDLSNPVHYKYVADRVDLQNLIQFYVIQTYFNNIDLTGNNVRIWRTTDPISSYGDGKWRFALYDLDCALLDGEDQTSILEHALFNKELDFSDVEQIGYLSIFRALLKNESFKKEFLQVMYNYIDTVFEPNHAVTLLREMQTVIQPEMPEHCSRWQLIRGTVGKLLSFLSKEAPADMYSSWETAVDRLETRLKERPEDIKEVLRSCFGEDYEVRYGLTSEN